MIFSFSDVKILKDEIQEKFGVHLHFHDGCGSQYFHFDAPPTDEMKEHVTQWFAAKDCKLVFSESGKTFHVDDRP